MSFGRSLSRSFALGIVLLALAASPALAAKKDKSNLDESLQNTFALVQNHQDPVAGKLVTWLYATETRIPVHAPDLMAFVRRNAHWPRMHRFREKIEEGISETSQPYEIADWFQDFPALTYDGIRAQVKALETLGRKDEAAAALRKFWLDAELNKNRTASIAGSYKHLLSGMDNRARLDNLIWKERYSEAEYMLAFVGPETRALGHARIALGRLSSKADAALAAVPAVLQNDESLLFERVRYRRRKNMNEGAIEILDKMPANPAKPEKWWEEIRVLARREIEQKDYKAAYSLARRHKMTSGVEYAQAEWLLGWLALRQLKDPAVSYRHFDALYRSVQSAISKSRAAYWAARAAEALPDGETAKQWDKISALYPSTFYGQLSYEKLYGKPNAQLFTEKPVSPEQQAAFDASETVRAARLLHKVGLPQFIDPFLAKLVGDAKSAQDYYLAAKLARETGRFYYAVEANKQAQQTIGVFLMTEGYPVLPPLPASEPEKSFIHAIIHRESMFDTKAQSHAGARGLMQLMPGTAKIMAKKKGLKYKLEKLTDDPQFNIRLGAGYLQEMSSLYGGFYPMAAAAYNAGPGRVTEWIDLFGDPRKGEMDLVDWIEHIPIYETRNYVQRVMESYYMYRLRFGLQPKTAVDFLKK